MASHWSCPYCNRDTTITDSQTHGGFQNFGHNSKYGTLSLGWKVIVCPNDKCKEYVLTAAVHKVEFKKGHGESLVPAPLHAWTLKPQSTAKPFPDYIPAPIRQDYNEACLIKNFSPKASATLARRCLQGMIRDFWGITKNRLIDEISAIEEKVDPLTWKAIDAVRSIGNIGAHMEKDINLIVEVDADEAGALIVLIETLFREWYINREERAVRMQAVIDAAAQKKGAKLPPTLEPTN